MDKLLLVLLVPNIVFLHTDAFVFRYPHFSNDYDGPFSFKCPQQGQFISHIESVHSDFFEDRIFGMDCSSVTSGDGAVGDGSVTCYDTADENQMDGVQAFHCRDNHYINGMKSHHDNFYEDRQWSFTCCQMQGVTLTNCIDTAKSNTFDHVQNFTATDGLIVHGMLSKHDNAYEDREYLFNVCQVGQTSQ